MKDKVFVKIRGLNIAEEIDDTEDSEVVQEDAIEVISVGKYAVVNGKEYVKYEEVYEEFEKKARCLIKIEDDKIEVSKKGAINSHLIFNKNEKTDTLYDTPYGSLSLGVVTKEMDIKRTEDTINIEIGYSLEYNYNKLSDNRICIEITSDLSI